MRIKIFDMDGTIVDSTHRYRTIIGNDGIARIDLAHWRANEHKAMQDSLLPLAAYYRECLANPNVYTIIATARVIGVPDMQFISSVLGEPDYLISRKPGSSISGAALKIKGLQRLFNLKQFKPENATFYEDNASYLKAVCDHFGMRGVYVPSNQGH